jgi:hypothetical protein
MQILRILGLVFLGNLVKKISGVFFFGAVSHWACKIRFQATDVPSGYFLDI